jgi:Uma2 family endonuclease
MKTKFHLYEQSGVQEYWLVDPSNKCVIIYYLADGIYCGLQPFTLGMQAESKVFPGLSIPVDDIFHKVE